MHCSANEWHWTAVPRCSHLRSAAGTYFLSDYIRIKKNPHDRGVGCRAHDTSMYVCKKYRYAILVNIVLYIIFKSKTLWSSNSRSCSKLYKKPRHFCGKPPSPSLPRDTWRRAYRTHFVSTPARFLPRRHHIQIRFWYHHAQPIKMKTHVKRQACTRPKCQQDIASQKQYLLPLNISKTTNYLAHNNTYVRIYA